MHIVENGIVAYCVDNKVVNLAVFYQMVWYGVVMMLAELHFGTNCNGIHVTALLHKRKSAGLYTTSFRETYWIDIAKMHTCTH